MEHLTPEQHNQVLAMMGMLVFAVVYFLLIRSE